MKEFGSHITFVRRNSVPIVTLKHLLRHKGVKPSVSRLFTVNVHCSKCFYTADELKQPKA